MEKPAETETREPAKGSIGVAVFLADRAPALVCSGLLVLYVITALVAMQYNWAFTWDDLILTERDWSPGVDVSTTYRSSANDWNSWGVASLTVGALTITAIAAALHRIFSPQWQMPALAGAFMLVGSGFFSIIAGLLGVAISQPVTTPLSGENIPTSLEALHLVEGLLFPMKSFSENVSLTFSGLAAIAFSLVLVRRGGRSRWLGCLGIIAGLALLLVWIYDAPAQRNAWTVGYLAWLVLLACWLIAGGNNPWRKPNNIPQESIDV